LEKKVNPYPREKKLDVRKKKKSTLTAKLGLALALAVVVTTEFSHPIIFLNQSQLVVLSSGLIKG